MSIAPPFSCAEFSMKVELIILVTPSSVPTKIAPPLNAWLSVKFEFITVPLAPFQSIAPPTIAFKT